MVLDNTNKYRKYLRKRGVLQYIPSLNRLKSLRKFYTVENLGIPMLVTAEEINQYELAERIRKVELLD